MGAKRQGYSEADNVALVAQVDGLCPLCGIELFYKKGKKTFKRYELAHVYPLNPTSHEVEALKGQERLADDVNHPDNIIPLCSNCHGRFDKPRTAVEYRQLLAIKQAVLRNEQQASLRVTYDLETQIAQVVQRLYEADLKPPTDELSYNPKSLDSKLRADMPPPLRQKIRHNVNDYYPVIRDGLLRLEEDTPGVSDLILSQVRTFYLKQRTFGFSQEVIFENLVGWVRDKTKPQTIEAAEAVTSYFIQNCEVFE